MKAWKGAGAQRLSLCSEHRTTQGLVNTPRARTWQVCVGPDGVSLIPSWRRCCWPRGPPAGTAVVMPLAWPQGNATAPLNSRAAVGEQEHACRSGWCSHDVTGKSQFWLFPVRSVPLAAFVIIITQNGLLQSTLPLCLTVVSLFRSLSSCGWQEGRN